MLLILIFSLILSVDSYQKITNNVYLIPGIGGSILNTLDKSNNVISRSWITIFWQNDEVAKMLVPFNQTSQRFDSDKFDVVINKSNAGLFSIYNLDPDLYIFNGLVEYFKHLIDHLIKIGYQPGVNLFGLPYDWRYSTQRPDILMDLHNLLSTRRDNILICHSMGGIIVENYIKRFGPGLIKKWIPIATPFRGVGGKIFQAFSEGYNLGNPLLKLEYARKLSVLALSTYELLPQKDLTPYPQFGITYQNGNTTWVDPLNYFQKIDPNFDRYRVYERNCFQTNVETYYISTSLIDTPNSAIYDEYYKTNKFIMVKGDQTVPVSSALNAQCHRQPLENNIDLLIKATHFDIIKNTKTIDLLDRLLEVSCQIDGTYQSNQSDYIIINNPETYYHDQDNTVRSILHQNLIVFNDCERLYDIKKNSFLNRVFPNKKMEYKQLPPDNQVILFDLEDHLMHDAFCSEGYILSSGLCVYNKLDRKSINL